MSKVIGGMNHTIKTINSGVRWCRDYPGHIGRHIQECIGVYSLTSTEG